MWGGEGMEEGDEGFAQPGRHRMEAQDVIRRT